MANRPTAADQIAALQKEAGVFAQPMDTQEKALAKHEQALDPHELTIMRERQARYEERVDRLEKERDESSRWWKSVALLALGSLLTVAVQLLIRSLGK